MNMLQDKEIRGDTMLYESPIGWMRVRAGERGVAEVVFLNEGEEAVFREKLEMSEPTAKSAVLRSTLEQLNEYFRGERMVFDLPLDLEGTPFRRLVWEALCSIPCGETRSYGAIAAQIDKPKAVRAVGGANHNNPVSIIVPCHRVIGSDGTLTGYGSGLWRKEWLLAHERKMLRERGA